MGDQPVTGPNDHPILPVPSLHPDSWKHLHPMSQERSYQHSLAADTFAVDPLAHFL